MEAKKMVAVVRVKEDADKTNIEGLCFDRFSRKKDMEQFLRQNGYIVYCILTMDQIEYYYNGSEEAEYDYARFYDRIETKNRYASEFMRVHVCSPDVKWYTGVEVSQMFEDFCDRIDGANTLDDIEAINDDIEATLGTERGMYGYHVKMLFAHASDKQEAISAMLLEQESEQDRNQRIIDMLVKEVASCETTRELRDLSDEAELNMTDDEYFKHFYPVYRARMDVLDDIEEQNTANSIMDAIIGAHSYQDVCDAIRRASNSDAIGFEMYNDLYELYKIRLREMDRDSYQVYADTIRNATDADTVTWAIDEATEDGCVSLEIYSKLCDLAIVQYDKLHEARKEVV